MSRQTMTRAHCPPELYACSVGGMTEPLTEFPRIPANETLARATEPVEAEDLPVEADADMEPTDESPPSTPRWVKALGIVLVVLLLAVCRTAPHGQRPDAYGGRGWRAARRATAVTLSPALRKLALTVHLTSSVGWIGAVIAYLALGVAAETSSDTQTVRAAWTAMELTGWWVIVPLAVAALLTGLVMSLGTQWGLFRHYWVLISLVAHAAVHGRSRAAHADGQRDGEPGAQRRWC